MERVSAFWIAVWSLGICMLCTQALDWTRWAGAAPLPRTGPITLEGTIEDIRWQPGESRDGVPGMSGSLSRKRTFPARYVVVLRDVRIVDARGGTGVSVDASGKRATLLLVHPTDDRSLKTGMRIRVTGYEEWGDEGGTWSRHVSVEVLK